MKPSTLKQLLKSSKDGLALTIQRQPGINLASLALMSTQRTCNTSITKTMMHDLVELDHRPLVLHSGMRLSNEFVQSPGTPKSTISESSMGYHSLTHSMPSDISNGITLTGPVELVGPDSTTGQRGLNREQTQALLIGERGKHTKKDLSDNACILKSSIPQLRSNTVSGPLCIGFNKSSYRNRPADFHSPRRHTTSYPSRNGAGIIVNPH